MKYLLLQFLCHWCSQQCANLVCWGKVLCKRVTNLANGARHKENCVRKQPQRRCHTLYSVGSFWL